jgi:thiamine-phosphate pyrophosphorylase
VKSLGAGPHACLITAGKANQSNFQTEKARILETIRAAAADGVNLIQIREKTLPGRLLFDLAQSAVEVLSSTGALVIVNDRPDVAVAAGAHGVHLPETSLPPDVVKRAFANRLLIGVSTHSSDAALTAAASGANYIFYGPIFETPGKGPPVGIASLKVVCDSLRSFPVLALGGIDQHNFMQALSAGAAGIAAIRSLAEQESRRAICAGLNSR